MRALLFLLLLLTPAVAAAADPDPPALDISELATVRGGQEQTVSALSVTTLTASNSGNTVSAETVQSGNVTIGADAFSGFDGIGNFILNTGNNNNLQGTVTITVVIAPSAP